MVLVGAGRHVECDGPLPYSVTRIKGRTVDTKLVDRFIGWIDIGLVAGVIHKSDWNAVELNFIGERDAAIDVMGASGPLYAGGKKHEGVDLPRQSIDFDGC